MNKIRFPDYFEEADVNVCELLSSRDWQLLIDDNEARPRRFHREVRVDESEPPRRKLKRVRDEFH